MSRVRRVDHREAASFINGAGKSPENAPPKQEASTGRNSVPFDPLSYLETLDPAHDALKGIGVSEQTLRLYRAGYCSKGLLRGRLSVGWADVTGEIKAFIGVGLKGEPPLFPKNWTVAYWFGTDHVEDGGELRIVPSILDVLQSAENGCTTICPLTLTDADAMTSLQSLVATYKLTVGF